MKSYKESWKMITQPIIVKSSQENKFLMKKISKEQYCYGIGTSVPTVVTLVPFSAQTEVLGSKETVYCSDGNI